MGLTWNPDFIKTAAGMAQAGQVAFSLIGGIVNIFGGSGLLGFAFWSTFFISGVLLLAHICNMAQSIEAGFPYFSKVELVYAFAWGVIFLIGSILSTISFAIAVVSSLCYHLTIDCTTTTTGRHHDFGTVADHEIVVAGLYARPFLSTVWSNI